MTLPTLNSRNVNRNEENVVKSPGAIPAFVTITVPPYLGPGLIVFSLIRVMNAIGCLISMSISQPRGPHFKIKKQPKKTYLSRTLLL